MDERAYWIALQQLEKVGSAVLVRLVNYFGSPRAVWEASPEELEGVPGLKGEIAAVIVEGRQAVDPGRLWEKIRELGLTMITIEDDIYPLSLREIPGPPAVLYLAGDPAYLHRHALAVVGTRRATAYGQRMASEIAADLARAGFGVVSGMARGIDTAAHRGALRAGGWTVAVLGSGLDIIYPPENKGLAAEITAHGVVISEFPPGTMPLPGNFPRRNRLISGLSLGTVVVEAGEKSGALITADLALDQGKDVFAVPGPVTSHASRGTNKLIKQGAKLVENVNDILEEYYTSRSLFPAPLEAAGAEATLEPQEAEVLRLLAGGPVQLDAIVRYAGCQLDTLLAILTSLEVRGLVTQLPGSYYLATEAGEQEVGQQEDR